MPSFIIKLIKLERNLHIFPKINMARDKMLAFRSPKSFVKIVTPPASTINPQID